MDHVVALKEAYDSGANLWSPSLKARFANDRTNMVCMDGHLNMSKSDEDLGEWSGGSCGMRKRIAVISLAVKDAYGLTMDSKEHRATHQAASATCEL